MVNCQNRLSMGRLFEPQDLLTNNQVVANALVISPSNRQTSDFWIGMNDINIEGTFQYTTGGDLVFTHWSYGEPNDSQVMMFFFIFILTIFKITENTLTYSQGNEDCGITWFGPNWNDVPCDEKYHSICEIGDKDTTSTPSPPTFPTKASLLSCGPTGIVSLFVLSSEG